MYLSENDSVGFQQTLSNAIDTIIRIDIRLVTPIITQFVQKLNEVLDLVRKQVDSDINKPEYVPYLNLCDVLTELSRIFSQTILPQPISMWFDNIICVLVSINPICTTWTDQTKEKKPPDNTNQITYCVNQLQRFSHLLATNQFKPDAVNERVMQFGYQYGRLVAMSDLRNKEGIFNTSFINKCVAHHLIMTGLDSDSINDMTLISYGFAIGYMQDSLKESHTEWWQPIASLIGKADWDNINEIGRENLKPLSSLIGKADQDEVNQDDSDPIREYIDLPWMDIKDMVFNDAEKVKIEVPSIEFLNKQ